MINKVISCVVEKALPDILFVSFISSESSKVYQGALIHRNTQSPPNVENFPIKLQEDNPRDFKCESFFSTLTRRHTYFENRGGTSPNLSSNAKKLGVRLRARQVLCHNCKNVCNEKGENVQQTTKRPSSRGGSRRTQGPPPGPPSIAPLDRKFTLVPKIRRLDQKEIEKFSESSSSSPEGEKPLIKIKLSSSRISKTNGGRRTLRKKRSAVGSMEDLWDENVFVESSSKKSKLTSSKLSNDEEEEEEETNPVEDSSLSEKNEAVNASDDASLSHKSTPVLKISFGSQQGRGTVLKIPARVRNNSVVEETSSAQEGNEENNYIEKRGKNESSGAKAAKKALKRARKEAQKRLKSRIASSPHYRGSPAYRSPGRSVVPISSPFGGSGNFSPARSPFLSMSPRSVTPGSSPAYAVILPPPSPSQNGGRPRNKMIIRRPKHKRKKHKRSKKTEIDETTNVLPDTTAIELSDSSINEPSEGTQQDLSPSFSQARLEDLVGQTVDSCMMEDGKTMCVGDVVWGKMDKSPWWPGKVTDIYLKPGVSGEIQPEAKVAWYAIQTGITSSLLLRAQIKPFRESYQDCFCKTQDGQNYKEAVEEASEELRLKTMSSTSSNNHSLSRSSSPRPIDCQN